MRLGITSFLTDRDMAPGALARAVEEHGFDSLYLPEHTHLPVRADVPPALVEGVRLDDYQRGLDPLVALSTAVETTRRIRLGTGILLVAQHDPIALAKQIATLDHLSCGRVTLGIGFGWNRAEAEDHGIDFGRRHALVREHLLCMQALWSQEKAEFHGEFVDLPPAWAWPKPAQQPRVRTLIGGGAGDRVLSAVADYADGWMPIGGSGLGEAIPRLHRLAEAAGRDPAELSVIPFGTIGGNEAKLVHYAGLGVDEVVLRVPAGSADEMAARLDSLVPLLPIAATLEST
jgi:probable F420-dependent oxidoreductase